MQDIPAAAVEEYIEDCIRSEEELGEWYEQAGYTCTLESIGVYGYSQGDYAEVYFLPDHPISFNFAQNLIYNAPIYCALDVDGETYLLDTGDCYNYDKGEILEEAKNTIEHPQLPYILEWLEENLPDHPDYHG